MTGWIILIALMVGAVLVMGVSAILMIGIGLSVGWGLIAHVIMNDSNVDGRQDP